MQPVNEPKVPFARVVEINTDNKGKKDKKAYSAHSY
jgi:hypothetical protein